MPVAINVSEIRRHIFQRTAAIKQTPEVQTSNPLLGRLFHESFAALLGDDPGKSWCSVVHHAENDMGEWEQALLEHTYNRIIGPRLGRERVYLRRETPSVLAFWEAVRSMNQWLTELLWTARQKSPKGLQSPVNLVLSPEEPLSMTLQQEGWSDSVVVTGIADLILRIPQGNSWCVVELKLGQGCPEADLAQMCLYHRMLESQEGALPGVAALVSFRPQKEEKLFEVSRLQKAQKVLDSLIGKLAGVSARKNTAKTSTAPLREPLETREWLDYQEQAKELSYIFKEYGTEIDFYERPVAGPAFIRYPVKLGKGVKLRSAQKVAQEIQHRLHLECPPLIHIAQGDVVVDIQRSDRKVLYFNDIRDQLPGRNADRGGSRIVLGVDLNNKVCFADLSEPENVHILVAGTTGSGKSEWLRTALAGAVLTNTPETLRLVLMDPKRNAFNELTDSPYLLSPDSLVYPDEQPAGEVLADLVDEMEKRYSLLHRAGVDNRDQFVIQARKPMPRILCVCDEYFDLISRGKKDREALEGHIFRLGAKSRAAGIHLILATQHPNRTTIKGALDANIPARVGLKMNKPIESNMLLNQKGAENLLGNGDLLFKNIGDPVRLQAPYLAPDERRTIFQHGNSPHEPMGPPGL